jgi:hypothetical protein
MVTSPLGFTENKVQWLVELYKDPVTKKVQLRTFKKERDSKTFNLFNHVIETTGNQPIATMVAKNSPAIHLEADNETFDLGMMGNLVSNGVVYLNANLVDKQTGSTINGNSVWAFYRKDHGGGYGFEFDGSPLTIEKKGFGSQDTAVDEKYLTVKNGELRLPIVRESFKPEGITAYVLREMRAPAGHAENKGYYIIRIKNGNPNQMTQNDYELALHEYQKYGTAKEKLEAIKKIDIDYTLEGDKTVFSTNIARNVAVKFFEKFGDVYGEVYEDIPDIYRVDYQMDFTYYPDGTKPVDKTSAAPPVNQPVLRYRYNYSFDAQDLGVEDSENKFQYGSKSDATSVEDVVNGNSTQTVYMNFVNANGVPTKNYKDNPILASTYESVKTPILLILGLDAVIVLSMGGLLFYFLKMRKKE